MIVLMTRAFRGALYDILPPRCKTRLRAQRGGSRQCVGTKPSFA